MMNGQRLKLNKEKGMTLIELLIGMTILGLVMAAFLPMSVLVRRTVLTNRVRLIATQIVNNEIERTIASTTPQNYPLLMVGVTTSQQTENGVTFTVTKDVEWVDDPSDGKYPDDPIPFDYKSIQVTASAPSYFNGSVTKYADFKTFLTREGADDPYAGVVVEVKRGWTNAQGEHDPVEGATVSLTPVEGGGNVTLTTGDDGRAITPVTLPEGSDESNYKVAVDKTGMMMQPAPGHNNTVTASRWETRSIEIQVEEPSTLKLEFSPPVQAGSVVLVCPTEITIPGYNYSQPIAAGQTEAVFPGIWPVGSGYGGIYSATLNLTAYDQDFGTGDGGYLRWKESDPGPPACENLWKFRSDLHGWYSDPGNYMGVDYFGPGENRLVSPLISLSQFQPNPNPGFQGAFVLTPVLNIVQSYQKGSAGDSLNLISKSNCGADPGGSGWQELLDLGAAINGAQAFKLDKSDMVNNFRLYFNASQDMQYYMIQHASINCQYAKGIQFEEPGQTLELHVN